jgi:hypothetical protein
MVSGDRVLDLNFEENLFFFFPLCRRGFFLIIASSSSLEKLFLFLDGGKKNLITPQKGKMSFLKNNFFARK